MNNGSAFAGYTGYVQPNAPGNAGAYGITFANVAGSLAMLAGRYVPLIAALAVAGALAPAQGRPRGRRHASHRQRHLRRDPYRRHRDRRRPELPAGARDRALAGELKAT